MSQRDRACFLHGLLLLNDTVECDFLSIQVRVDEGTEEYVVDSNDLPPLVLDAASAVQLRLLLENDMRARPLAGDAGDAAAADDDDGSGGAHDAALLVPFRVVLADESFELATSLADQAPSVDGELASKRAEQARRDAWTAAECQANKAPAVADLGGVRAAAPGGPAGNPMALENCREFASLSGRARLLLAPSLLGDGTWLVRAAVVRVPLAALDALPASLTPVRWRRPTELKAPIPKRQREPLFDPTKKRVRR